MGKFADSPFFILDSYWNEITPYNYTYPTTARLIGLNSGIVVKGGYGDDLYVKTSTDYLKCRFLPDVTHVTDNSFLFHKVAPSGFVFDAGDDVYIRKDSYFHEYVKANTTWKDDFINVNRYFMYFGKIYPTSNSNEYIIMYDGMKDYTLRALPLNNRTTNIEEILRLYFDKIYSEIYNRMKMIWTLHDPIEVDSDFLNYIAQIYSINLNENIPLTEERRRFYIKNLIYKLKRYGTYSSQYIVWKNILQNTTNTLKIYERWHDWNIPLTLNTFEDHEYITFSDYATSASSYPTYSQYTSGSKYLSPHYKVEMDFSNKPEDNTYIIDENTITNLYEMWEDTRPATRVSHYYEKISPLTDFTQNYTDLYSGIYPAYMMSKSCITAPDVEIHQQDDASSTWTIEHGYTSKNVLVQFFDTDYNQIFPETVTFVGSNSTTDIITDSDTIDLENGFGEWLFHNSQGTRVDSAVVLGSSSTTMGALGGTCLSIKSSGSNGSGLFQTSTVDGNTYRVDFLYYIQNLSVSCYVGVGNTSDPSSVSQWNIFSQRNAWKRASFTFEALSNMYIFIKSSDLETIYIDNIHCVLFDNPPTIVATFPSDVSGIVSVADYQTYTTDVTFADDTTTGYVSLGITIGDTNGYQNTLEQQSRGFLPASIGASSSTRITDYYWKPTNWCLLMLGGNTSDGVAAGIFCYNTYTSTISSRNISSRLCF